MNINNIEEKKRNLFPSAYLTLMSVIQASVFGLFLYTLSDRIAFINNLEIAELFTFLVTVGVLMGLLIVTWNEYMMHATSLVWMPGLADSSLSFLTGIVEALTVYYAFEQTATWYFVFSAFPLVIFWVYYIFYSKARKYDENATMFEALNKRTVFGCSWKVFNYCSMLAFFAIVTIMGIIIAKFPHSAVLDLIFRTMLAFVGIGFGVKSYLNWSMVTSKLYKQNREN